MIIHMLGCELVPKLLLDMKKMNIEETEPNVVKPNTAHCYKIKKIKRH